LRNKKEKMMNINKGKCYLGWCTEKEIREKAASGGFVTALFVAALETNLVDEVILVSKKDAYEGVPVVTSDIEEVKSCAGSMHFAPLNLAAFADKSKKKRVALSAKPCDARGVVERMKRRQIEPRNTYMVGLNCGGTFLPIDAIRMVSEFYHLDPEVVEKEEIVRGRIILETKEGEKKVSQRISEVEEAGYTRRSCCRMCDVKIPRMADLACGNWGVPQGEKATFVEVMNAKGEEIFHNAVENGLVEYKEAKPEEIEMRAKTEEGMKKLAADWRSRMDFIADMSREERLSYYIGTFSRCIGCGACREVCPVCVCEGGVEDEAAKCISFDVEKEGYKIPMFNLVRLFHLMDSCIGCGQCEDVCPVDIPLTLIHKRFQKILELQVLDYRPGMDMRTPPLQETEILFE
jgi:formate dehydrogenase subunit beta